MKMGEFLRTISLVARQNLVLWPVLCSDTVGCSVLAGPLYHYIMTTFVCGFWSVLPVVASIFIAREQPQRKNLGLHDEYH